MSTPDKDWYTYQLNKKYSEAYDLECEARRCLQRLSLFYDVATNTFTKEFDTCETEMNVYNAVNNAFTYEWKAYKIYRDLEDYKDSRDRCSQSFSLCGRYIDIRKNIEKAEEQKKQEKRERLRMEEERKKEERKETLKLYAIIGAFILFMVMVCVLSN